MADSGYSLQKEEDQVENYWVASMRLGDAADVLRLLRDFRDVVKVSGGFRAPEPPERSTRPRIVEGWTPMTAQTRNSISTDGDFRLRSISET